MNSYSGRFVRAVGVAAVASLVALFSQGCGVSFDGSLANDSAIALASQPAAGQECRTERNRAMWITRPGPRSMAPDVVRNLAERNRLFEFSTRGDIDIKDFFLSVPIQCQAFTEDPLGWTCTVGTGRTYRSQLRDLIRRAHDPANYIRVHLLTGEATRALRQNHNRIRREIRAILEFNEAGTADERFDGIHLDVEPHSLQAYKDAMQGLPCESQPPCPIRWDIIHNIFQQFLDMNVAVVEELAGQNMALIVDVPDSWHPACPEGTDPGCDPQLIDLREDYKIVREINGEQVSTYPTYHLMYIVKDLVIMSYHRNANTMIRKTEHAVAYAAQPAVGARIYVGVQTAPPCRIERSDPPRCAPGEPPDSRLPGQTMGHLARSEMETQLCRIDSYFAQPKPDFSSFKDFSYFKYFTYRDMRE